MKRISAASGVSSSSSATNSTVIPRRLTLPTPEGGGCSGYARPKGPRWRLTGLPGPTARGAACEEVASTEPCTQRRAHNGETALSPCLKAGACAPTEKVRLLGATTPAAQTPCETGAILHVPDGQSC